MKNRATTSGFQQKRRRELPGVAHLALLLTLSLTLSWMVGCTPPTRDAADGTPPATSTPVPERQETIEAPSAEPARPTLGAPETEPAREVASRTPPASPTPPRGGRERAAPSGAPATPATPATPAAPPAAAPAPPRTFALATGHSLSVWTSSEISTKTAQEGDRFEASLANAIVDEDWIIARKGARVDGVVVSVDPGGRVSGVASLTVKLTRLTLADGRTIALSTSEFTREAKTTKGKDAAKIGIGAGVGAAIGAIAGGKKGAAIGAGAGGAAGTGAVLATRGDAAVIGAESQITVRLLSGVTITQK
ncbi:MAG: hypothetical protein ACO394_11990 [Blastocatellia bacterium]